MKILAFLVLLLMGSAFVAGGIALAFDVKGRSKANRWQRIAGGILMAIGAMAFFGNALGGIGGFLWLPDSFEWPAGYSDDVLTMPDGSHVVALPPINRIQIYDSNWKFVRGWWIQRGLKGLTVRLRDNNKIAVSGSHFVRYIYSEAGDLLSEEKVDPSAHLYHEGRNGPSVWVPTRIWLIPFSGPFSAWITLVLGMGLLAVSNRKQSPSTTGKVAT